MLKPILHSIINQPTLWSVDAERIKSVTNDTVWIDIDRKRYRMSRPVIKYLTYWEKLALKRAIKVWKKKKIAKAAKQVNASQHQR